MGVGLSRPRTVRKFIFPAKWHVFCEMAEVRLALRLHFTRAEVALLLTARHAAGNRYSVEVSGWDSSQTFFVEKSEVEWGEDNGKQLTLSHALNAGAMIFVRLLQPMAAEHSWPVPYQAERIDTTLEGNHQFRLTQVQPRTDIRAHSTR